MAAEAPLNLLVLGAASVADDLGYVALSDLGRALSPDVGTNYRVIGGHMVTALVARWQLGADLYRETGDTDLGVPPVIVRDHHVIERLLDLGYERVAGNRFAKTLRDVPLRVPGDADAPPQAVIDVLVPAYTSRARNDRRVSDELVTTEVLGLPTALNRPPVLLALELHRLNGERLDVEIAFPDEVAALVLKAFATRVRNKETDVVDVWRCLEVAFAAGVDPHEFADGDRAEAARHLRALFERRDGPGMRALEAEQHLSGAAADERFTRLRALIARVLGPA
ncbi:MAG TPA: hypothetical protein VM345_04465 [Acidimicrobiales bacterium]|jgi:hypothetical protein|nr:hypothetical protein [Acidimicrobiales bacterium]